MVLVSQVGTPPFCQLRGVLSVEERGTATPRRLFPADRSVQGCNIDLTEITLDY
jgi:hypothetical protein